jgi:hypothetical protein
VLGLLFTLLVPTARVPLELRPILIEPSSPSAAAIAVPAKT